MLNYKDKYNINFKNILNLKVLNDYKNRFKEIIKSANRKINLIENQNKTLKGKLFNLLVFLLFRNCILTYFRKFSICCHYIIMYNMYYFPEC